MGVEGPPTIRPEIEALDRQGNVQRLPDAQLRQEAERYGTRTIFGNYAFHTMVKNRSAGLTVLVGPPEVISGPITAKGKEILQRLPQTLECLRRYLTKIPLVCVERRIGDNPHFAPLCRTYVSVARPEMIRIAYMWSCLLFPSGQRVPSRDEPLQRLVYIPEWQEHARQIVVFPEDNTTLVLGSDYLGESKKGHLRMAMWNAKKRGMLGIHAGAKLVRARDAKTGRIRRISMLLFGLTATGKTTHSCHNHGLDQEGEGVSIVQDDVVFLRRDGSALGSERGFYLKTEGLNPETQPLLYDVATRPDAVLENVLVDHAGRVDFDDETLTTNGRGVVQWRDFGPRKAEEPNLPSACEVDGLIILFITRRNTVVPIASRLSLEQAAAAFMLGESVESSGGDPQRIGESVRVVGTNPFIVGDEAEEGNRFLEFLEGYGEKASCYLLNTGGVGEAVEKQSDGTRVVRQKVTRVQIPEMAAIIRGIVRDSIEWEEDPLFGSPIPRRVEGVDLERFRLSRYYTAEQLQALARGLVEERRAYLERFPRLNRRIAAAAKANSACLSR